MRHSSLFAAVVALCLMFTAMPVSMAAQPPDSSSGSRAIDSASLTAVKTQPGAWQTGPFPPAGFQYARHDGAFVPGPQGEPWANKIYFPGGRTSPGRVAQYLDV